MPGVFGSVWRAERKAAALPTGYRINLGLYALVLIGIALISVEVRSGTPPVRQVETRPRPVTETTKPAPVAEPEPPTVLGPGDLIPTPPPAVTPGGAVVRPPTETGGPAPEPAPPDAAVVVLVGPSSPSNAFVPALPIPADPVYSLRDPAPPPAPGAVRPVTPPSIPPVSVPVPPPVRVPDIPSR